MAIAFAAVLLSGVVIFPTLAGLFLSGRGNLLRILGAILVLPLVGFWVLQGWNLAHDTSMGRGDGWTELIYFVMGLALGAVGAIIGAIGRAQAGR
jgi:hypothetical protein